MVELAEKTITAPSASRQSVAVSSMLYSVECGRRRFFALLPFAPLSRPSERALIPAP